MTYSTILDSSSHISWTQPSITSPTKMILLKHPSLLADFIANATDTTTTITTTSNIVEINSSTIDNDSERIFSDSTTASSKHCYSSGLLTANDLPVVVLSADIDSGVLGVPLLFLRLFFVTIVKLVALATSSMPSTLVCGQFTKKLFDVCWPALSATHRYTPLTVNSATIQHESNKNCNSSNIANKISQPEVEIKNVQQTITKINNDGAVCVLPMVHTKMLRELQRIFHSVDIFPTEAQVYEMIQFARRYCRSNSQNDANEANDADNKTLTFGELCCIVDEFISNVNSPRPVPRSMNQSFATKIDQAERESFLNPRSSATNLDIFLGGSCNPTTWRRDIVIPELKRLGITYYNPQVDHWVPELIELENQAKQNSEILFFVIDNQTRAIASMMEIAFIAATKRKLILVISDFSRDNCKNGISDEEYEVLLRAREYLRDVVERQGIPVFNEISPAINCAARVLRENIAPQDLERDPECEHDASLTIPLVRQGHLTVGDKLFKLYATFDRLKNSNQNCEFTFADLKPAFGHIHDRELPDELLKQFAREYLAKQDNTQGISLSRSSSSESPDDDPEPAAQRRKSVVQRQQQQQHLSQQLKKRLSFRGPANVTTANKNRKRNSQDKLSKSQLAKLEKIELKLEEFYCIMSELHRMLITRDSAQNIRQCSESWFAKNGSPIRLVAKFNRFVKSIKTYASENIQFFSTTTTSTTETTIGTGSGNSSIATAVCESVRRCNGRLPAASSSLHSSRTSLFDSGCDSPIRSVSPVSGIHQKQRNSLANTSMRKHSMIHHFNLRYPHLHHHSHLPQAKSAAFSGSCCTSANTAPSLCPNSGSSSGSSSYHASHVLYNTDKNLYIAGIADEAYMEQISLLKKFAITYATFKRNNLINARMMPVEAAKFDRSKVLLFAILRDSLDISLMVTAAYYIGLQYNVVLCIQNIDPDKIQPKVRLSENAIKDFNRGRSYLSDFATKVGVPVFSDLKEAFHCSVGKVLEQQ